MPYSNILVALNCKDDERNVVHEAVQLASVLNANLSALHVNDPGAGKTHAMMDAPPLVTEEDIRELFRKFGYEKEANEIMVHVVEGSSYPKEIGKACEDIDLLVMGHSHKNQFLAALIDAVDERVADIVSCPVLVVPKTQ